MTSCRSDLPESEGIQSNCAALLLSGGGNRCFFHLGVIRVLLDNALLPKIISGSSAGSLIAALAGTRAEPELRRLLRSKSGLEALAEGWNDDAVTMERYAESLDAIIPDVTFAEALEISGRAVNISLTEPDGPGGLICGPATTPDMLVRDAVVASCAVPGVFDPVAVRERKGGRVRPFRKGTQWSDGSFFADVPVDEIKRTFGVRKAIVSMVNPIVRPFLSDKPHPRGIMHQILAQSIKLSTLGWLGLSRACALPVPRAYEGFDTAYRVVSQSYTGDLTLMPSKRFVSLRAIMQKPTFRAIRSLAADGEARTRARLPELRALAA
jgi:TAG lipase / steryl ester hydrolase / phospholipase A2 / LPA acyltransferase